MTGTNVDENNKGLFVFNDLGTSFVRTITQQGGLQTTMPFTPGVSPSEIQVQNHLQGIAALAPSLTFPQGNVTVLGGKGGPFTVIFNGGTGEPAAAVAGQWNGQHDEQFVHDEQSADHRHAG